MHKIKKIQRIVISIISFLICCHNLQGQELIGEIKIPKNYVNITNLSGSLNDSITFHLIINKNKKVKNYQSKLYFFNESKQSKVIDLPVEEKKPIYLAFHTNDSMLTLIRKPKKGTTIEDINYLTGEIISKTFSLEIRKILSHKNTTFLMGKMFNGSLDYAMIKNTKSIKRKILHSNKKIATTFFKYFIKDSELINDVQFIENGPIKVFKGFYNNENLSFVNDAKKQGEINIINIDHEGNIDTKKISVNKKSKLKKMSSFIKGTFLFNFSMSKTNAFLNIYDIKTSQLIKSITYNMKTFGPYTNIVINGKKTNESFNKKRFYKSFFPQAIGSMYNAELYIGVNKSDKDGYIVKIGHLDKNTYKNQSSENFWWHSPAFSLQYNVGSGRFSSGFNPVAGASLLIFHALAENKRKGNYFEINLDADLNHTEEKLTPFHKFFDENQYLFRIKNLMTLKRHFFIPQKKNVRMINFNRKDNVYLLYNLPLIK